MKIRKLHIAYLGVGIIAITSMFFWFSSVSVQNVRRLTPVGFVIELNVTKYSRMPGAPGMLSIDAYIKARGTPLLIHRSVLALDESDPEKLPSRVVDFRWDLKEQKLHVRWIDSSRREFKQIVDILPLNWSQAEGVKPSLVNPSETPQPR